MLLASRNQHCLQATHSCERNPLHRVASTEVNVLSTYSCHEPVAYLIIDILAGCFLRISNSNSSSHTSVRAPTYPQPLDYQASLPALHPHRIAREMLQAILEPVRFEQEEEVDEMEPPDFHQRFASNGQDRAYSSYARAHRGITPSDSTSRIQRGVGMRFGDDPSAASDLPHPEFSIHPALDVLRHSTHRNFSENTHSQPRSLPPEHHQSAYRSGPSTDAPSTSSPFPSNILHMPHSRLLHSSFLSGNVPVPAQGYMPVQPPGIAPAGDKETLDDSLAECILGRSAGSAVYHIPCLPPEGALLFLAHQSTTYKRESF